MFIIEKKWTWREEFNNKRIYNWFSSVDFGILFAITMQTIFPFVTVEQMLFDVGPLR